MIGVGFSIFLGFAVNSIVCGLIANGSQTKHVVIRKLVGVLAICVCLRFLHERLLGKSASDEASGAVISTEMLLWFALGAAIAIAIQLVVEGSFHSLWVKIHPQSAPTPEARFGQRAQPVRRNGPVAATLMGTSTDYLNSELDLRTETLIRLCFYAFEDRGPLTLSLMEASLRLGTGRRQKVFHKLAAGIGRHSNLKQITHRFSRSVNGSSRMTKNLFSDLCRLSRETRNQDRSTNERLVQVGLCLGLSREDADGLMRKR